MISVSEAKELIRARVTRLPVMELPLLQAAFCILASDIYAGIDIPAFEQSSMDGYAIRYADKNLLLTVSGEMAAGSSSALTLNPGEAIRIFTGAPVPAGADTVVMQEKVTLLEGKIRIDDSGLSYGLAVRPAGSEIRAGALALHKEALLTPAALGFLAGIGISHVPVYPPPSVSILVTGNELQQPGKPLGAGQVYESNSYSLTAALHQAGISVIYVLQVEDKPESLQLQLEVALAQSDLVILTGGVSVGDYDFVPEAAAQCGVEKVFHQVRQKPGKPLYFGMKGSVPVFGLPGNPSSVLSCFYNYVLEAVALLGARKSNTLWTTATLANSYSKPRGLTHFLKGSFDGTQARILQAQASYQLSSFAEANCLVMLAEDREQYETGEEVELLLLPGYPLAGS